MNFLTKFIFFLKKPKVIIVTGKGRNLATEAIYRVLLSHFKVKKLIEKTPNILSIFKKEIFIIETDLKKSGILKKLSYWIKLSQLPILVVTHIGEIPTTPDFFSGESKETKEILKLAKIIPAYGFLILNFDDKVVREIDDITNLKTFSFGFQTAADFRASDIKINNGTNFKINHKGNIIPIWFAPTPKFGVGVGKEQIYSVLAASSVGIILGLNFIEISEALKNYRPPSGKNFLI